MASEINVLAGVFQVMQTARADEDDVILLGDLNASEREFGQLGQVPGIAWAVTGITTNTRKNKMYDNILVQSRCDHRVHRSLGRGGHPVGVRPDARTRRWKSPTISPCGPQFRICESPPANNTAQLPGRLFQ